jgi:Myb-like DNA-binding domain
MHTGSWSSTEEGHLIQIMQYLSEEGKTAETLPNFWKEVAEWMDNTRTAHQCCNKWYI